MSRTKEQRSWDTFSKAINPAKLKVQQTELLYSGEAFPDVLVITRKGTVFLLENKALDGWPVRATTQPLRTAFEPGQLAYMRSWQFWKGRAFVLLRVGLDYYLLNPDLPLDTLTRSVLVETAIRHGKKEIIEHLESL